MGLRLSEGLDLMALAQRLSLPLPNLLDADRFAFYQARGLLWQDGSRVGVTAAGMPLLDALLGEVVPADLVAS